jgi:hypothetical protein
LPVSAWLLDLALRRPLGPLVTGIIDYRYTETFENQGLGPDAFAVGPAVAVMSFAMLVDDPNASFGEQSRSLSTVRRSLSWPVSLPFFASTTRSAGHISTSSRLAQPLVWLLVDFPVSATPGNPFGDIRPPNEVPFGRIGKFRGDAS